MTNLKSLISQWNTTFGTPQAQSQPSSAPQPSVLSVPPSSGAAELPTLQDIQTVHANLPQGIHPSPSPQSYSNAPAVQSFVTPAMWQESVASVYEGGMKRGYSQL